MTPKNDAGEAQAPAEPRLRECWGCFNPEGQLWDSRGIKERLPKLRAGFRWVRMVEAPGEATRPLETLVYPATSTQAADALKRPVVEEKGPRAGEGEG